MPHIMREVRVKSDVYVKNIFVYYCWYAIYWKELEYLSYFVYMEKVDKREWKLLYAIVAAVGIICLLPSSNLMREKKDDSLIQWSAVTEVVEQMDGTTTVLMDADLCMLYYFPCHAIGAKVYPVMNDIDSTLSMIGKKGQPVLYLTHDAPEGLNNRKILYRQKYSSSQDDGLIRNRLGLPKDFQAYSEFYITLAIYD